MFKVFWPLPEQNKNILNQKSGFNRCLIPRLSVMMGALSRDANDESEFDQLSSDNARRGRKKKHGRRHS